ncbi:MAG: site-specific integrase [FCB group bacterium]|jgi:integrase|nr:site-specific integrase [FCB group bacterium]
MPQKNSHRTPKLCRHFDGRAYVRLRGKFHYLGQFGTPEASQKYHALLAELAVTGLDTPLASQPRDITLAEALEIYLQHARGYYAAEGRSKGHISRIKAVLTCAADLYGAERAADFGPLKLRAVQGELVTRGHCRTNINAMCGCLKLCFKWLASHELVPASVALALTVVSGLRSGKTEARESDPVRPVSESDLEATRAKLPDTLRAMVDLQLACGARSGEIFELRPCDIDRSGAVWTVTISRHKTAHRGKARVLYLGPKAQAVLRPFLLNRGPADYLFDPREAIKQRSVSAEVHRRKNQPATPRKSDRTVGGRYDTHSYRRAIARAVAAANADPERAKLPPVANWHPHQLRHNAATAVRKAFGLEAAQAILGHARADVTQIYAEVDREKALKIAAQIG